MLLLEAFPRDRHQMQIIEDFNGERMMSGAWTALLLGALLILAVTL